METLVRSAKTLAAIAAWICGVTAFLCAALFVYVMMNTRVAPIVLEDSDLNKFVLRSREQLLLPGLVLVIIVGGLLVGQIIFRDKVRANAENRRLFYEERYPQLKRLSEGFKDQFENLLAWVVYPMIIVFHACNVWEFWRQCELVLKNNQMWGH